ncbi:MAG: AsnC family transcriptional regulator [Methanoculleus sp. SDB]|nr:MAG: AsnC family transcriptional regulator [Methanoculleus sp. SDB]
MADIEDQAFRVIHSRSGGVLQSELWKILDIDSRKCSRVVKKLLDEELIERIEYKKDGINTYLLRARKRAVNPSLLLAGGDLIPCIACDHDCVMEECPQLTDWLYQLAIEEIKE